MAEVNPLCRANSYSMDVWGPILDIMRKESETQQAEVRVPSTSAGALAAAL